METHQHIPSKPINLKDPQHWIDSYDLLKKQYDILFDMYRKIQVENVQMRQELILERDLNYRSIETMRKLHAKWTESVLNTTSMP